MAAMTMIQALRSAMDVMLGRDDNVVIYGQDVGYFGGVFRCTDGLQAKYGKTRVFDAPISEGGIVGSAIGMAAYGLQAGGRGPVRRLLLPGVGPDRLRGGAPALSLGGRLHRADHDPHAVRRRHLRRPDAQPEPGVAVHPRLRHPHGDAEQSVRRQGPADRVDRERRSGHLPRAQAPLQRPVRRPPRQAGRALVGAPDGRGARGPLHGAARIGDGLSRRRRRHRADLRDDGVRVRGGGARERRRRRDRRPAQPLAARPAGDRRLGEEDRPLRRRPRGDAHQRLRRRAGRAGAGALLLSPRGADRARHRLGHAVSARARVGVLSRARTASPRRSSA